MEHVENPSFTQSAEVDRRAIIGKLSRAQSGARWFFWIAGLSALNSIITHSDGGTSFVVGLGVTIVADYFFKQFFVLALIVDVLAIGTVAGLGFAASRGFLSAYWLGILLYSIDAAIYLYFQDWMPLAFHCYALFFMVTGALELQRGLNAHKVEGVAAR